MEGMPFKCMLFTNKLQWFFSPFSFKLKSFTACTHAVIALVHGAMPLVYTITLQHAQLLYAAVLAMKFQQGAVLAGSQLQLQPSGTWFETQATQVP